MIPISETKLKRTILKLAWPIVVGEVLLSISFIIDAVLVGPLGNLSFAAVGQGITVVSTTIFPAIGITTATSAIVARYLGENNKHLAGQAASYGFLIGFIVGVGLTFLAINYAEDILKSLSTEPDVIVLAESYVRIVMSFCVFFCIGSVARGVFSASGNTRPLMTSAIVGTIVNTVGSIVLIYGFGPFPEMKVDGAALATGIGYMVTTLFLLLKLIQSKIFALRIPSFRIDPIRKIPLKIVSLALPNFGEMLLIRGGNWVFYWIVTSLGTISLSAHYISIRVEGFAFFPAIGLATTMTPIVGQCLGAGEIKLAKKAVRETVFITIVTMMIVGGLFLLLPMPFVRMFSPTDPVYDLAIFCVQISAFELIPMGLTFVYLQVLKAAGDTLKPMIITLFGTVVTRVGIVYLLANHLNLGLPGVWYGTTIDWGLRALAAYIVYRTGKWIFIEVTVENRRTGKIVC